MPSSACAALSMLCSSDIFTPDIILRMPLLDSLLTKDFSVLFSPVTSRARLLVGSARRITAEISVSMWHDDVRLA